MEYIFFVVLRHGISRMKVKPLNINIMKKFYVFLMLLLAMTVAAKANPVSVQQARKVGAKYLTQSLDVKAASEQDLKLAATYRTESGVAAFYIFNGPGSFVIVSADDCATPILGSSATNQFYMDDIPPALEEYLQGFVEQIQYGIESRLPALDTVAHQWEIVRASGLLRDDRATAAAVAPLLTTTWGQGVNGRKYNIKCPSDPAGQNGHAKTGCTATAMAQIMRYWRYPGSGQYTHGYYPPNYPDQYQYVNFGNVVYDWDNMPDELNSSSSDAQNDAVATLMWHCGVGLEADYGPDGTSAYENDVEYVMEHYFKYSSDAYFARKQNYDDTEWLNMIKGNLNKGWPIHMRGANSDNNDGHMFVLDGYNADDHIHINWGWNGSPDDYYPLSALTPYSYDFSYNNSAVFDIHPGECEDNSTRSLPYSDGFEAGSTQWWCWDKVDYSNSSNGYQSSWTTSAFSSGGMCVRHNYNASRTLNDWAIMPQLFLQPGRDLTKLTFLTYEAYPSDYIFEGVYISTTGTNQDDFTLLWSQSNPSSSWKTVTINLDSYQGQAVYIAFVYKGKNGHNWFIDNVNVTEDWQPCSTTSLPFEEHFDSNINGCWYIIDGDMSGGQKCWQWKNSSKTCAYHPYGQQNKPQVGWLVSRSMFLQPGRDATTLTFYSASTSSGTGQRNSIWLAIDKPIGELTPSDFTVKVWEDPDYSNTWTQYTVNLSAYQGHTINIGFKYEGTYAHNWFVDDVVVTESWTPCGYVTAPTSEAFNSSLGGCWYVIDSDRSGGERCWKYDETEHCAIHPWGQQNIAQEGWLFSQRIWLPPTKAYKLSFKSKIYSYGTGRRNSVWIAVDKTGTPNPSDYTEIWVDPSYSNSWTTYEIDLSAYSGHFVNIAFKYEGTYAHNWYVDDFSISEIPTYYISATASPSAGGSVSGAGIYIQGASCTLTATANSGYTFANWTKNGTVVSTNPTYTFTVNSGGNYVAHFTQTGGGNVTQTTNFTNGWNWWSGYVELNGASSLQSLENGLGTHGVMVKSQNNGYASYLSGYGWYGSLTAINNECTYQVKTNAACTVSLSGNAANPASHPVTLTSGWTWVGYPVNASMSVSTALGGITPQNGDMLKSQNNGYASYLSGYGWYGSLSTLNPGMGLMYKSNRSSSITLTYPNGGSKGELKSNQTAEGNHWQPNLSAYPDNMSVMAVVELDGEELASERYELAAFANGECRGSARLMYVEPLDRYMAFLTVAGDEATGLHFGLYNVETGDVETQNFASLQYETNAVVGGFDNPYVVSFRNNTSVDEWTGSVNLFPNPVERGQKVSLGLPSEEKAAVRVEIVNTLGMVVETLHVASEQTTITAPKVAGVYTLGISVEGKGTCYRKLVVR